MNLYGSSEKFHQRAVTSIFDKKLLFLNWLVIRDLLRKSQNYWGDSLPSETTRTLQYIFGQINLTYKLYTPWETAISDLLVWPNFATFQFKEFLCGLRRQAMVQIHLTVIASDILNLVATFQDFRFLLYFSGKYIPSAFPFGVLHQYQGA